ncbi:MAG: hypothetical protein IJX07_10545, partial [Bacillales bacterium]|nr:hypothetical protein [Bacillales bacterium]
FLYRIYFFPIFCRGKFTVHAQFSTVHARILTFHAQLPTFRVIFSFFFWSIKSLYEKALKQ